MSKAKIIASVAASAALATLPAVATFATGATDDNSTYTDHLSVAVSPSCYFTRISGADAHTNGAPHTAPGGSEIATGQWGTDNDTLSGTLGGDDYQADFGKSHFNVKCNNVKGWKVTATPKNGGANGSLKGSDGNAKVIAYAGSNTAATEHTATWGAVPSIAESATKIVKGAAGADYFVKSAESPNQTTGNDGVNFDALYSVSTDSEIPSDTYTGDIEYEFFQLDAA